MLAAFVGDIPTIQRVLERYKVGINDTSGPFVVHREPRRFSALHYAALGQEKEAYGWLIAQGIDQSLKDSSGRTARQLWNDIAKHHRAAQSLPTEDAHASCPQTKPRHMKATLKVTLLLAPAVLGSVLMSSCVSSQGTAAAQPEALVNAVLVGDVKHLQQLIAKGADVNAKDGLGLTPLCWAKSEDVARLLIAKGADVNARDWSGQTALHTAASSGRNEVVALLIEQGANVNAVDNFGETPLYRAVLKGDTDTVRLLIRHGADVGVGDLRGNTPLHCAPNADIAALLIGKGANVRAANRYGYTPLHEAARQGYSDVAKLLIAKGADVNAKDKSGRTPLFLSRDADMASLLVNKGASVQITNIFGHTPLHWAAWEGRLEVVRLLLKMGADAQAKDDGGHTPLDRAEEAGKAACASLLRSAMKK